MLRFSISVFTVAIALALVTLTGSKLGWWLLPGAWREILIFISFITLVVYYKLSKLAPGQTAAFAQFYLLSIVLKLTGSLALIFFIVWDNPADAAGNVTLFIISYLLLTFVEVYFLLKRTTN